MQADDLVIDAETEVTQPTFGLQLLMGSWLRFRWDTMVMSGVEDESCWRCC